MPRSHPSPVIGCPMRPRIAATLAELRQLRSPVVRSCHVGNNTANIWGWLALARHARIAQVDHTLYGVDEVCLPWMVLDDGGRAGACYDYRGEPVPSAAGRHASELCAGIPRKHRAYLNFGIFAEYRGEDLMRHHFRAAAELSRQMNGSVATHDSFELASARELFAGLIRDFHRAGLLGYLFDRWILPTRKGQVALMKLRPIAAQAGGDLALHASDGRPLFRGSIDRLLEVFFAGVTAVHTRLAEGGRVEVEGGYPWIASHFGYFLYAVKEAAGDAAQRTFWHGGGSTSQYYINDDAFQEAFRRLRDRLAERGYLPAGACLRIVPTYCCQLFATDPSSLPALAELVEAWRGLLQAHRPLADRTIELLEQTTAPLPVAAAFCESLSAAERATLLSRLAAFNAVDPNRLPVAHASGHEHPHYNKYGMAQSRLAGKRPLFPDGFEELRWGEAELLVKALAQLTLAEPG